jgi:hypothetical protein
MKPLRVLATLAALVLFSAGIARAVVIGSENFDGGVVNLTGTANVFDYGSGGGSGASVFGRVSSTTGAPFDVADDSVSNVSGGGAFAGDVLGLIGQNASAIFAMNNADTVAVNDAVWTFNISSAIFLSSISIDIGAMGDFESSSTDGFLVEFRIDGGSYAEIFKGRTDETASKTYLAMDSGTTPSYDDPLQLSIDGSATGTYLDKANSATGLFSTYTSTLVNTLSGTSLDLRISWAGTPSGSEPIGFDNITINGVVPEPSTIALVGLGLAGFVIVRRRRKV